MDMFPAVDAILAPALAKLFIVRPSNVTEFIARVDSPPPSFPSRFLISPLRITRQFLQDPSYQPVGATLTKPSVRSHFAMVQVK